MVTKEDLLNSEKNLKASITQLDNKIDSIAERLEHKILQSEYRSTIKLGSIVTVVIAAATAVIKFF